MQVTNGKLLGTISRSIFNFTTDEPRSASLAYDGKAYSDADGVQLTLGLSRKIGKVAGLMLKMNGQKYQLIETERVIGGTDFKPLDDPDAYRALVDAAQVAQEERDSRTFEKLRPCIESAIFRMCQSCLDSFGQREGCPTRAGNGFVRKSA